IPKGSIYGIIGMSGAGKSTLLRCLTGLEIPTSGSILFDQKMFPYENPQALRVLRQKIGMVFQHFQLFSSRTVAENIAFPLEISNVSKDIQEQRVDELLKLVGLENKKQAYPSQLSGGEKQRVGIARALAAQPSLLLCDEPTSALDPKTTRSILGLLKTLNQKLGITIVLITHQLECVKQICDRIAVLSKGQIIEEGNVKEIFIRPTHEVTKRLVHLSVEDLPKDLLKRKAGTSLVRLGFEGHQATEPVISRMIKHFQVDVNILSGGLDYIQNTTIGHLFVELSGKQSEIDRVIDFLKKEHVVCEVIQ
ncbi:MAG: ATP-binding cassette domain-containing protein, partial [Parachlamydiaceae bacterium]|nr:ATP-binding cassette domain-containing protein [Parachlamydiaceae bacterium]